MQVVSISHEVKVANWNDGKDIYQYRPQNIEALPIRTVSWGKNGTWLILVPEYNPAEIISLAQKTKLLHSIQCVKNTTCAAFQNSSSRKVAVGTNKGQLVIYDIKEKCIKRQLPSKDMPYFKVQYTMKDSHLVSGCKDGKVYIYKTTSGIQIASLSVPKSNTLTNFRCHPLKSNILGLCSEEGTVAVWDFNVQKPTACYEAHRASVSDIVLRHETVLSIGIDRQLCLFDYRANKLVSEHLFKQTITAFDLYMDGYSLCLGFTNGDVNGFDLRCMKESTGVLSRHTSKINQISFDNLTSKMPQAISEELSTPDSVTSKSRVVESFSDIYCTSGVGNSGTSVTPQNCMNASDSFMDVLGHNLPTSLKSFAKRPSLDVKERNSPIVMSPHPVTPNNNNGIYNAVNIPSQGVQKRVSLGAANSHSTPISSTAPMPSPIIPEKPTGSSLSLNENEIRRIVKETVQEELGEFRKEMSSYMQEVINSIRQNTLGLQWSLAKLSVNLDEHINQIRCDIYQEQEPF